MESRGILETQELSGQALRCRTQGEACGVKRGMAAGAKAEKQNRVLEARRAYIHRRPQTRTSPGVASAQGS